MYEGGRQEEAGRQYVEICILPLTGFRWRSDKTFYLQKDYFSWEAQILN